MKKFLLLIVALAVVYGVSAQPDKRDKEFTFGPKVGLNITSLHFAGLEDPTGAKSAVAAGLFGEYQIGDRFAVAVEVIYSRQGYRTPAEEVSFDRYKFMFPETNYRMQYLNVPILAKYYVARGLAVEAGLQVGFLLEAQFQQVVDDKPITDNIKGAFRATDFAIPVGVSYTFETGLVIDARYHFALRDISTEALHEVADFEGSSFSKAKNRVFTLSLGWKF